MTGKGLLQRKVSGFSQTEEGHQSQPWVTAVIVVMGLKTRRLRGGFWEDMELGRVPGG